MLERLDHVGGAAVSAHAFDGVDARLSRYSYLVSLLPRSITDDLGARVRLARRTYSSYTPDPATAGRTGLLVGPGGHFDSIGAADDAPGFDEFYRRCRAVTQRLWPTLTATAAHQVRRAPTRARRRRRRRRRRLAGDDRATHRGRDHRRRAQRPGPRRDGDRRPDRDVRAHRRRDPDPERVLPVPPARQRHRRVGRARSAAWARSAGRWRPPRPATAPRSSRAQTFTRSIRTATCATATTASNASCEAGYVLSGVTPTVLARLLGEPGATERARRAGEGQPDAAAAAPAARRRRHRPRQAFGGTFHINETLTQLDSAYDAAAAGRVPDPLPCEIYCHSLTDPTILSDELRRTGAQTLTVFGLHTPHALVGGRSRDDARHPHRRGAGVAELRSRRAHRGRADDRCARQAVHRGEDHRRPRGHA